jgi:hypothetical protein
VQLDFTFPELHAWQFHLRPQIASLTLQPEVVHALAAHQPSFFPQYFQAHPQHVFHQLIMSLQIVMSYQHGQRHQHGVHRSNFAVSANQMLSLTLLMESKLFVS